MPVAFLLFRMNPSAWQGGKLLYSDLLVIKNSTYIVDYAYLPLLESAHS